ncbi:MAG: Adenosine kinase [Candidatus Pacebacteria bacterium GW2011_GWF2_38_9]|nr:MAG: adenosine kinase, adenosine kinase [candidate division TM6 bacterium GW2011_GWF2_28_16]KKQ09317.1 MAG: Adenosine kinase [Candidatus Pacebacteria bacterium GW2011_GWF1_36_5]KKQ88859.1 MAG: Adenosine kinase [Candidatus Pacebacteria bacterium GW2011_GWF2_38_9]HAZ73444.1 carbohydrate kinase family protein [Candidatus Paceibacterota bacterium]
MKAVLSGSIAIDQIMSFDGSYADLIQPDKLHVLSISPLVKKMTRTRGGIAGNIAYSLALLGEKPILLASAGSDATDYLSNLEKIGVNLEHMHLSQLPTATFSVLTDSNNCQVGGFYPGAMSDASSLNLKAFANDDVLMVVSAHDPGQMAKQVLDCRKLHKKLLYDPGQQSLILDKKDLEQAIDTAEILIVNDYEMGLLCQKLEMSKEEIIQRLPLCIITLGKEGAFFYQRLDGHQKHLTKAVLLKEVLDPTGAGDAFRAGFIYAYLHSWSIKNAIQLANVVASFAAEQYGTQNHQLKWPIIKQRYKETYGEKCPN